MIVQSTTTATTAGEQLWQNFTLIPGKDQCSVEVERGAKEHV